MKLGTHLFVFSVVCCSAMAISLSRPALAQTTPAAAAKQVDAKLAAEVHSGDVGARLVTRTSDEVYLRRVYLDIVGEVPTTNDILAFSLDADSNKRAKVVNTLLADKAYGENWARYWRDVIMYRRTEQRSIIAANSMTEYLTDELNANAGWDKIARAFITATGDVQENGATGLIMAHGGQPEDTVAEASRVFMGIQIQCAQCHDHPYDRWKREQFHELAAFFPRVAVRPSGQGSDRTFLVNATDARFEQRRANNNNRFRGTPEHYMPDLNDPSARGKLMQPVFFATGQELKAGVRDAERRATLADWMTSRDNPWFAKAIVNRMWSELVGEGFYEPVDDIGPDRDCSAPETLAYLSTEFVNSGHDVKWLMRTITATEAYQRDSLSRRNIDETPFLANCPQRLRADQLYSQLIAVLEVPERGGARRGPYGAAGGPRVAFNQLFGYDPSERRDEIKGSIPQALALMNSPLINGAISARPGTMLGRLMSEVEDNDDLVVEVYLRTLARQPSEDELNICLAHVKEVGNRGEAFEDILWSLINSTEFAHRR